jgi:ubiquinone/menaquinone biosynthesis C-methylase UbiE
VSNPYYKQHWIDVEAERHQVYDQILNFHPAMEPMLAPLELAAGLKVLDVGSGPGHTTIELARRVGDGGRVTGVDINQEFVDHATQKARELSMEARLEYRVCSFPPLPFADSSFDRVWCKNVLEYVDSAAATVAEMARVTSASGIVVAVDSDWEMLALQLGNPLAQSRSDRILDCARRIALKEPRIGRKLHNLFREAGLAKVQVKILSGADQVGRALPMLRASLGRYAVDSGDVASDEVRQWLADIDDAIAHGRYLFVLPQFVVRGARVR